MIRERGRLPTVLFELSVMRDTVRGFRSHVGQQYADSLLTRLAILESKALRLIDLQSPPCRASENH